MTAPTVIEVIDGEGVTVDVGVPAEVLTVDVITGDTTIEVVEVATGIPGPPGPPGAAGTIVAVGPTPPPSPAVGDLWVDTS